MLATPSTPLNVGELPVSAPLLLCAADSGHLPQLENLAKLAQPASWPPSLAATVLPCCRRVRRAGFPETFTIINPRSARPSGRHAGQGGQEYESDIASANLDGSGEAVSAKSLMK